MKKQEQIRVLYLTSWSYGSGISIASAWPSIRALCKFCEIEAVTYVTLDQKHTSKVQVASDLSSKVSHIAVRSFSRMKFLRLVLRHIAYWRIARKNSVDLIICRGSSALPFALAAQKRTGAALVVESFEPHSGYMVEAGQWARKGLRAWLQSRWERMALDRASHIITVSKGYAKYLVGQGVSADRLSVLPCTADPNIFRPNDAKRVYIRDKLGADGTLCVYAGKFGGLYLEISDAVKVLSHLKEAWREHDLQLLILSPDSSADIRKALELGGWTKGIWVLQVDHSEVPDYLSAADFGISFHRASKWSFALSPIKHAEYWASGLPVFCPKGIGDDCVRILGTNLGAVADTTSREEIMSAALLMQSIISQDGYRDLIRDEWMGDYTVGELESVYLKLINMVSRDILEDRLVEPSWSSK